MYAIKNPDGDLWAKINEDGVVTWSACDCGRAEFETEEAAEFACLENGINVDWIVAL